MEINPGTAGCSIFPIDDTKIRMTYNIKIIEKTEIFSNLLTAGLIEFSIDKV